MIFTHRMRRFLPSLPALQAFEAAARLMNFTKAAEEMGMTQSGVSRHVHTLEQFLGLRLFERVGSQLVLTDMGRAYFEDVVQVLGRLEEVSIDAVRGRRADEGIVIGATSSLGANWLIPKLGDFARRHPGLHYELTTIEEGENVENSHVDVAIMRGSGQWHGRAIHLFDEELAVVASPDLIRKGEAPAVLDFATIPTLQNASRYSLWLTWLRISGMPHQGAIQGNRFSQSALIIRAAVEGLGLAVVPVHYVRAELDSGALYMPFGPPIRSGDAIWMVYPDSKAQRKNVQLFRDWLRSHAVR